jgi:hypothetical protein
MIDIMKAIKELDRSTIKIILLFLFILVSGVVIFTSCEDEKDSPIIFSLTPKEAYINAAIGDKTTFHVDIRSTDPLINLHITQQDNKYGLVILQDSTLHTTRFIQEFVFEAPIAPDSMIITLSFKATDQNQHIVNLIRRIRVLGDNLLLEESTGHVLFSALSGGYSAFNLDMLQPLSKDDNPDSLQHFADHSVDSIHFNTLSREWNSPAGYRFVRFEGFSYPEATKTKLQNAYDSGIKLSSVDELVDDDVILIGHDEEAIAVIYIVQIIDVDSTLNDKYLFNIKK